MLYFFKTLQNRVLRLLEQSLAYGGFLCLGTKESLRFSDIAELFKIINDELDRIDTLEERIEVLAINRERQGMAMDVLNRQRQDSISSMDGERESLSELEEQLSLQRR